MLASSRLQTIICTSRLPEAERFYGEILSLPVISRSHGGVIFNVGGGDLLVMPVPSIEPSTHTTVGFAVPDLARVMTALEEHGVQWVRVPGLPHDESGVVVSPWGARVVWFRDPDGNILSIVQYA
jgi:catechol 2,3-dioxygenase-like lactoylglutathione lyase family enzyme